LQVFDAEFQKNRCVLKYEKKQPAVSTKYKTAGGAKKAFFCKVFSIEITPAGGLSGS
jgi:hypothetical protein